jgi:hypothetical protein
MAVSLPRYDQLHQTIEDWHTTSVTLSGAKGLGFRRDASPPDHHDRGVVVKLGVPMSCGSI